MPDEGEHEIERTLRAYAQKRREQAGEPLELHPATRRLLQGEAARLRPKLGERPKLGTVLWLAFRRRLAFVAILAALAVASAWLFSPWTGRRTQHAGQSELLAKNEQKQFMPSAAPARAQTPAPASPPPPAEASSLKLADKKVTEQETPAPALNVAPEAGFALDGANQRKMPTLGERGTTLTLSPPAQSARSEIVQNEPAAAAATPAAVMPPTPPPESAPAAGLPEGAVRVPGDRADLAGTGGALAKDADTTKSRNFAFSESLSAAKPAPDVPPGGPATATDKLTVTTAAPGTQQSFYRLTGTTAGASVTGDLSAGKGVLENFRLEQSGNQLVVVDADGSRYSGFVQAEDLSAAAKLDGISQMAASGSMQKAKELRASDSLNVTGGAVGGAALAPASTAAPAATAVAQTNYFRVLGTNRSSGQSVVFSGTFAPAAVTTSLLGATPRFGAAFKNAGGGAGGGGGGGAFSAGATRSEVHGRALVGGTNVIEVNAAASAP